MITQKDLVCTMDVIQTQFRKFCFLVIHRTILTQDDIGHEDIIKRSLSEINIQFVH
jgi:hypothetical protein